MTDPLRTARYLATLVGSTGHQALRVVAASLAGVKQQPGGVYDDAPRAWGHAILDALGIAPRVEGLERLERGQPYVFVSNHASYADVWVLVAVLPGSVRFVAKKELLRIPLFGQALRAGGQIVIDRHQLAAAFRAYDGAAEAIRAGMSAIVFVEGTRSRDGSIQAFKKGPFVLAIHAGVPIVPVYVEGTYHVLPRGRLLAQPHPVTVRIGDPIPTAGFAYEDRDVLAQRCREAMLALRRAGPVGVDPAPGGH